MVTISRANAHVKLSKLTIRQRRREQRRRYLQSWNADTYQQRRQRQCCSVEGKNFPEGGGIYNGGTLTIKNSTVSGNNASDFDNNGRGAGGGIYNTGTLAIADSTFSKNLAGGGVVGNGGGIDNVGGTLTITNSTFSGNLASGNAYTRMPTTGGSISSCCTLMISNSTFSGNSAGGRVFSIGGGIYATGTTTLQNAIVANSSSGGNCSAGYDLEWLQPEQRQQLQFRRHGRSEQH